MSKEVDVLGRALHHAGLNVDRTTLGVALRHLESSGYRITPVATTTFHTQPAEGAAGTAERGEKSPERGARRV